MRHQNQNTINRVSTGYSYSIQYRVFSKRAMRKWERQLGSGFGCWTRVGGSIY